MIEQLGWLGKVTLNSCTVKTFQISDTLPDIFILLLWLRKHMLLQCQLKEVQNMELPDLGFPASTGFLVFVSPLIFNHWAFLSQFFRMRNRFQFQTVCWLVKSWLYTHHLEHRSDELCPFLQLLLQCSFYSVCFRLICGQCLQREYNSLLKFHFTLKWSWKQKGFYYKLESIVLFLCQIPKSIVLHACVIAVRASLTF